LDFDADKISRYREALEKKYFLLGEEHPDAQGLKADWAHFEFILAAHGKQLTGAPTDLILMRIFWSIVWEYLGPFIKSYETLSENFEMIKDDMESIIVTDAERKMELDLHEEWMKKHAPNIIRCEFRAWAKEKRDEIEAKIKKIREDEAFKQEEERKIIERARQQKADKFGEDHV